MKIFKVLFFILALSMVLESCSCGDCGSYNGIVELKDPEITQYNLYHPNSNVYYDILLISKYDTPEAYIYRYVLGSKIMGFQIIPKNTMANTTQDTESILGKGTYFEY